MTLINTLKFLDFLNYLNNLVLGISVNDKKAFHCKIVCLINLNKFDEALSSIEKFPNELNDFYFEKAYCQYRLNLIENALQTLQTCPKLTFKEKELLAQVVSNNI